MKKIITWNIIIWVFIFTVVSLFGIWFTNKEIVPDNYITYEYEDETPWVGCWEKEELVHIHNTKTGDNYMIVFENGYQYIYKNVIGKELDKISNVFETHRQQKLDNDFKY